MESSFPFIAALMASMLHVITGPDHLAAVTPFAIETKRKAWKIGLSWGLGHLAGMLGIGILFALFKELIPVELISDYSEQLVGFVLLGIGAWALYKLFKKEKRHAHLHVHSEQGPAIHKHPHDHSHEASHHHHHPKTLHQTNFASFSIGLLHGLAGISHFLLFLPVLSFEDNWDASSYIGGFGAGIILAMTLYTFVIGKVASLSKNGHNEVFFKGIRFSGGLFAIIIGIYWIFST
jgi:ABC-type nickel/cobalt efflux system permease component RcnA